MFRADRLRITMKIKLDRIISIATLVALVVAIVLVLKKPAPPVQPQVSAGVAASVPPSNAVSSDQRGEQPESMSRPTPAIQQSQPSGGSPIPSQSSQSSPTSSSQKAGAQSNSDAIGSAINKLLSAGAGGLAALAPNSNVGDGSPNIKDQKVDYDGDMVHGQFLTEIGGKDVWVTISGHMGQKDGYATFDPTEFKVGDMNVPVALVNPALQNKLAEERDRLKVSDPATPAK
jgi:hypothetical protein